MTAEHLPARFDDEQFARLIQEQGGVLHRRDIPPEFVRYVQREIRTRRWQRIGRDVFVAHNGPLDRVQQRLAALKASPPMSALAGLTAAELGGLRGFESDETYLALPCGARRPRLEGIVVHYTRFLESSDVHPLNWPRRTRQPRSIIDGATWFDRDGLARAIILAGVQQRLVSPEQLRLALPSRGPCLRHALIAETIADAAGGIASLPEREFAQIVRAFQLPEPVRQRVLQHGDGRYFLDADWTDYDLAVEVDGRPHMDVTVWDADLDRANEIVIDRRTLLRFTSYAIRRRPALVGSTMVRALVARGWRAP